jgi:malonate decarboxylase epsilon subunit
MTTAFLFPGQGAQRPGMLRDLELLPGAAALLDSASTVLGRDLRADDNEALLRSTEVAQRALFIAGVASARALIARGVEPDAVAGHSIGTFGAAVIAGSLAFEDALRLVDLRSRMMAEAFPSGYGMGSISGLDERTVTALTAAASNRRYPVYAANVNAPDQIAIAGANEAIATVLATARAQGARSTRRLDVVVPSHTPLMDHVAATMTLALEEVPLSAPSIAYATNAGGSIVRDEAAIRHDLGASVATPVLWANATRALYDDGIRLFVEMQPGDALTNLAARAFADARAVALEIDGLDAVVTLAEYERP